MEFLTLSKFKLQLQALIGEIRDLRERERQARDDLQLSIQKQKQSDAVFGETLQTMREDLALCNESREKLEIEVKYLQQENTMLEMKQKELKEIINSLLQSRETFVKGYEDSTCELKSCIEKRDKRLILLSQELQAHLRLFDSIQIEAFSVKQIVEKVECLVNEKEQVGMFKATLFLFHCKGVIFPINKGENAIFKKSVSELKRKMDGISTLEKESKEKMACLEKRLRVNQDEVMQKNASILKLKEQLEEETLKSNMKLQIQESALSVKEEMIQSLTMGKQVLHLEVESLEYTLRKIQDHVINICTKDPEQLFKALEVQQPCQIVSRELSEVLNEGINVDPKDPADYNHSGGKGLPLCQEHSLVASPYQDKDSLESSASRVLGSTDHQSTVDNVPNHSTDKRKGSSCNSSVHQVDSESSTT